MTPNDYQNQIVELSMNYPIYGTDKELPVYSLGLGEETGEVLSLLKRYFRGDKSKEDLETELVKELGDLLAYLSLIADYFDISLEDVMKANLEKIESRKNRQTLLGQGNDR